MGNGMNCHTTPKSKVWQGVANTFKNRCHTTPPPKGGGGWGDAASPVRSGVGQNNGSGMLQ